ncbi:protease inhibitor I42 family protein [Streptomyces europaeiscabiei]|uniref:protease inhibitor I42 family protein n=1 Tax=Streptomyces europaeiscabiei TaxID=146819 RepID=UPI0038F654C9
MPEVAVDHTDEGRTVGLHVGDVLVVTLPVNMLTGLHWETASYDQRSLALIEETVIPPPSGGALGAGGTVAVFRFRTVAPAPALSRLVLDLRRGREPDEEEQKYRLLLDIKE